MDISGISYKQFALLRKAVNEKKEKLWQEDVVKPHKKKFNDLSIDEIKDLRKKFDNNLNELMEEGVCNMILKNFEILEASLQRSMSGEEFVSSTDVKRAKQPINKTQVALFIDKFNTIIRSGGKFGNSEDIFHLNNMLDGMPSLNSDEFELAVKLAKEKGWELVQKPDNYQTTQYRMKKINQ